MKILVTGATGFIGQYVVRQLLADGHTVVATGTSQVKASQVDWFDQVTFVEYNLPVGGDNQNLYDYFDQPDALIHLAWQGLPNYKATFHFEQNLFPQYLFLKNLIHNGLQNLTVTGTCFEYGMQEGCLSEDQLSMPANPYALAKDTLRKMLQALQTEQPFSLKWARLFYMYGDGQNPNSVIPLLERAIEQRETVFNMSGGEQLRDYLPVEDVAIYLCRIATQMNVSGIINCCSGQPISIRRFVEHYLHTRNATISLNLGYYSYPDYEPMAFWGNNQKLTKLLLTPDESH
ncbi:NAD-dependent epimerase/dehydratase family protein [Spirosoma jeollabukense]